VKSMVLNEREFELLEGEPHLYFRLYLLLRWAMDRKTRRVGSASAISWGWMGRELEVLPKRGRHTSDCGKPSAKALRSACDGLEALGLVQPCGNGETVVFLLPKATVALSRPNDEGQVRGRHDGQDDGQGKRLAAAAIDGNDGQHEGQGSNGDEGRQLRYQGKASFSVSNKVPPPCTDPVDNFGTEVSAVAVGGFMKLLRKAERQRNCVIRIRDTDPLLKAWARDGVTLELLQSAYDEAAWEREKHNDPQPINAPFLDTILRRKLNQTAVSRGSKSGTPRAWHTHAEGIAAKAQEIGLVRMDGEVDAAFLSRVSFEVAQIEDAAREAKKHGR
jgi:hypothetical protein